VFIFPIFVNRSRPTNAELWKLEQERWDRMTPEERVYELALIHGPEVLTLADEIKKAEQ